MPVIAKVETGLGTTAAWSFNHTMDASTNLLIVGVATGNQAITVSSVGWATGGEPAIYLTKIVSYFNTGVDVELWGLLGPGTGSGVVSINLSGLANSVAGAIDVSGASMSALPANTATNKGSSLSISSTLTNVFASSLCIDAVAKARGSSETITPSQNQDWNQASGSGTGHVTGGGSDVTGSGSVTLSWTISGSTNRSWAACSCEVLTSAMVGQLAQCGVGL